MRSISPSKYELRPYQQECLASIPESGAFLVDMATGLGKSLTFSRIQRRGRMLILSHRDELVRQPAKYFDCPFGIEQAQCVSHGEDVVSASVQSLVRRLDRFEPDEFDVIVTDEAHHAAAESYRKIYSHFKPRLHVGFTATPNRGDGIGLDGIFEDIVFERDLEWGIRNGYLSDIFCIRANVGYDLKGVAERMGDFAPGELEKAVNIESANRALADIYRTYAVGQTLIFACSVAHARAIAEAIPGAHAVIGGEDREDVLEMFAQGRIKCLVNCMVFTEGTDLPNVETVMIARPTKNESLYTQMVGRGTRLHPGKKRLVLIDCVGVSTDANLCTAPSLLGLDMKAVPERSRAQVEGALFDLPEIVRRKADTPECWIRNVEYVSLWAKGRKYRTHDVNWFRFPDGSMYLSKPKFLLPPEDKLGRTLWNGERVPTQRVLDDIYRCLNERYDDCRALWDLSLVKRWGAYSATDKQRALITQRLPGFDTSRLTKMEANQILTRVFNARGGRNATGTRKAS